MGKDISTLKQALTLGAGKKINKMEKEKKNGVMGHASKVPIKMDLKKVMELFIGMMGLNMKEIGRVVK